MFEQRRWSRNDSAWSLNPGRLTRLKFMTHHGLPTRFRNLLLVRVYERQIRLGGSMSVPGMQNAESEPVKTHLCAWEEHFECTVLRTSSRPLLHWAEHGPWGDCKAPWAPDVFQWHYMYRVQIHGFPGIPWHRLRGRFLGEVF